MGVVIPEEDYSKIKELSSRYQIRNVERELRKRVLFELISAYESFKDQDIPDLEGLIGIIVEEAEERDLVWMGDGGSSDSIKVYYEDEWRKVDQLDVDKVDGYEIIRMRDKFQGPVEEKYKRFYRIRKVTFEKVSGKWKSPTWIKHPTEVTKLVRETVKGIKVNGMIEVILTGSAFKGTMGRNSNLNYVIVVDESYKIDSFYDEFYKRMKDKYKIFRGPHTVFNLDEDTKKVEVKYGYIPRNDSVVEIRRYVNNLKSREGF